MSPALEHCKFATVEQAPRRASNVVAASEAADPESYWIQEICFLDFHYNLSIKAHTMGSALWCISFQVKSSTVSHLVQAELTL